MACNIYNFDYFLKRIEADSMIAAATDSGRMIPSLDMYQCII